MKITHTTGLLFACALASAACSSSTTPSSSPGPVDAGQDTAAPQSDASASDASSAPDAASDAAAPQGATTLTLNVPADFAGATRQLDVVLADSIPIMGPPSGILLQEDTPQVAAGQPRVVHADASAIHGSYYVVVVLYMQGGGKFSPKSGVDYVATSKTKLEFTGAPIDLAMDLAKAP